MVPEVFRVERRAEEFPGTFTLHLSPIGMGRVAGFQPGQFSMLYAFGTGEVPISISGPSDQGSGYVYTIRTHGMVTRALENLREGGQLGVRGPFGSDWPISSLAGREILLVAGGLGLAPLRPVIYTLLSRGGGSAVRLFYGARSPREMLYRDELVEWSRSMDVQVSVDQAERGWTGRIGAVTDPLAATSFDAGKSIAFLCGPEVMMRFCIRVLLEKGMPPSAIYLSMERNMKCATGHCGHCQWGPSFICKDGPVFRYEDIRQWFHIRAL
ncbi:FAD/NAD(P)-binding protein [Microbulbifer rhizosphaerae]|uniref:NAD(P)H-flavin reductase n=1 Tax=Microbulbifer rhizosphaerae TaxID=1562603 RepID=A0A7W4WAC8_9GAMM|nr:NAD(P)H-flavin reductase [Microbulbifer rhizosphaerae]